MSETVKIFGLTVRNESLPNATERLVRAAKSDERQIVFFINAHCINVAAKDPVYLSTIPLADLIYADGIGMRIAVRLSGGKLIDNVNGTDMFPMLCEKAAQQAVPIALLGAKTGIAERCAQNLSLKFPGVKFPFVHHGYLKPEEEAALIECINESGAKILLVAFGVPGQELWIAKNAHLIHTPVILAVGGLFDFYSGLRVRAPWLVQKLGLEWSFRLAQEPRRLFGRYVLGNPVFLFRALLLRLLGNDAITEKIRPCGPSQD